MERGTEKERLGKTGRARKAIESWGEKETRLEMRKSVDRRMGKGERAQAAGIR